MTLTMTARLRPLGLAAALLLGATAAVAQPTPLSHLREVEDAAAPAPAVLPLKEQARIRDAWLKERLDTIVPALMREQGVDMWVMIAREYLEDPVLATMLNATSLRARRRTILVFFDPGDGKPVERLTVSRYGLGGLFEASWEPEKQPDQWARLGEIVAARDPRRIAVNTSPLTAFGDGLTLSQHQGLMAALPERYRARVLPAEGPAVGWVETRPRALWPGRDWNGRGQRGHDEDRGVARLLDAPRVRRQGFEEREVDAERRVRRGLGDAREQRRVRSVGVVVHVKRSLG